MKSPIGIVDRMVMRAQIDNAIFCSEIHKQSRDGRSIFGVSMIGYSMVRGPSRMSRLIAALTLALAATSTTHAERLDRNNLLAFHNDRQEVAPVRSIADWQRRRAEIIAGMQEVMGTFPGATKRV